MNWWQLFIEPGPRYSGVKAILLILLSAVATGSLGIGAFCSFHSLQPCQQLNFIQKIIQVGDSYQAVKTEFFAETLGLSIDAPTLLHHFNVTEAEKQLLGIGVFKDVHLKKIKPDTLFIRYRLRTPIAYVGDFTNTAVDKEGILFPAFPFFTPKKCPRVILGEEFSEDRVWGKELSLEKRNILSELFSLLASQEIRYVDLSAIDAPTLGHRQLVVVLGKNDRRHFLRLSPKSYRQEITHYFRLLSEYLSDEKGACVIDLRFPQVAYLSYGEQT